MFEQSSFVTLTYSDENFTPSLEYQDFQIFMKRLRHRRKSRISFYMCGEYGEKFFRPHFHACLFGVGFPDRVPFSRLPSGDVLYRSAELEDIWRFGYSTVGEVTFKSAAYVARYVMKKITGAAAVQHYQRTDDFTGEVYQVKPEFNRMSLRPAIGSRWIEKYYPQVFAHGSLRDGSRSIRVPRFYDEFLKKVSLLDGTNFDDFEFERFRKGVQFAEDNTRERLAVREAVVIGRQKLTKRTLE